MFAIPVVMATAFLADQLWTAVPLAVCAWWWAPREPRWYWLIAVGRGIVATEWTVLGEGAFTAFPSEPMTVGLLWAGVPMLFALRRVPPAIPSGRGKATRKRRPRLHLPARTPIHLS